MPRAQGICWKCNQVKELVSHLAPDKPLCRTCRQRIDREVQSPNDTGSLYLQKRIFSDFEEMYRKALKKLKHIDDDRRARIKERLTETTEWVRELSDTILVNTNTNPVEFDEPVAKKPDPLLLPEPAKKKRNTRGQIAAADHDPYENSSYVTEDGDTWTKTGDTWTKTLKSGKNGASPSTITLLPGQVPTELAAEEVKNMTRRQYDDYLRRRREIAWRNDEIAKEAALKVDKH